MYMTPEWLKRRAKRNPQMDNSLCTYMVEPRGMAILVWRVETSVSMERSKTGERLLINWFFNYNLRYACDTRDMEGRN